jgi:putative transposase|tara:strand:- start:230 stop:415 length:186 start_codon:yes stop_codon:yes gene_type:complete
LAFTGIEACVGSVGGPYDNALAAMINGLLKAEGIHRLGPWKIMNLLSGKRLNGSVGSTIAV